MATSVCPVSFHQTIIGCATLDECATAFAGLIGPIGFDTFACGEIDTVQRQRMVFQIIRWADAWRDFYMRSGLVHRDPIVEVALEAVGPFTWSQLRADHRLSQLGTEAIKLAARHGYTEGLVVPIRLGGTRRGIVSLAGGRLVEDDGIKSRLSLVAHTLHRQARILVQRDGFAMPPMGLTPRELETLNLVALGKSDREIAMTQAVSTTTAHDSVERVKRKMAVRTRAEAVAVAATFGMLNL